MKDWRFVPLLLVLALNLNSVEAQEACEGGADPIGWLGLRVEGRGQRGSRAWFHQEPSVDRVYSDGPAAGVLKRGDIITAIDGVLVTTRAASSRLIAPPPGQSVQLRIRRHGIEQEVVIEAQPICIEDRPQLWTIPPLPPAPPRPPAPPLAPQAPLAPAPPPPPSEEAGPEPPIPPAPPSPALPAPPPPPSPPPDPTRAGLGFGFECSACRWDDSRGLLLFGEPPRVYSVESESQARRAGLRRGDLLTHVDGVSLTTREGAVRFFTIEPGDRVKIRFTRGGVPHEVELSTGGRSIEKGRALRDRIDRFQRALQEEVESVTESRETRDRLKRSIESKAAGLIEDLAPLLLPGSGLDGPQKLRFAGSIGQVGVEVNGLGSVHVEVGDNRRRIAIRTLDSTILLSDSSKRAVGRGSN